MYISFTLSVHKFFFNNVLGIVLPNNGIAFLLILKASKGPSHKTIGSFQLTKNSNPITSLLTGGFLYL